jgi:hypothetical protein
MSYLRQYSALAAALVIAAGCSESPTAPPETTQDPAELSIITPFILPPGADWGLYFQSFNRDKTLTARVIHYPDNTASGSGYFAIPGIGTGVLRVTSAMRDEASGCIPQATTCGPGHNVPESGFASGIARFLSGPRAGRVVPFELNLHSNLWPNPTNTFDIAILDFCSAASPCGSATFYGELHHEPQ